VDGSSGDGRPWTSTTAMSQEVEGDNGGLATAAQGNGAAARGKWRGVNV
jgi:hypothetical protein